MKFLVHANFTPDGIAQAMGKADYSYFFVQRAFLPVLESLGSVVELRDPAREADELHAACLARGEDCVLLAFAPPHALPATRTCPVIPVFAWEYGTLPDESWRHDRETDWTRVLARTGVAITHSAFAVDAVHRALTADFTVMSVPAPVWDRYAPLAGARPRCAPGAVRTLALTGSVLDSRSADLSRPTEDLLAAHPPDAHTLALDGVVYTAVFCPVDGRKNWEDLLSAFCWAFRDEPGATLVMKLVHHDGDEALGEVLHMLRRLPPCAGRLLLVHAHLDDAQYAALVVATDFVLNSSLGEGQCLPLMEYMAAGVPAIAPDHTAMRDYLDATTGFPVGWSLEWTHWPQDMRLMRRTVRHRPDWGALRAALCAAHTLRTQDPPAYWRMSAAASERQRWHCSQAVARRRLREFLRWRASAREQVRGARQVWRRLLDRIPGRSA
jgi:glycosyltransferase involved in cell wall biosynthesis